MSRLSVRRAVLEELEAQAYADAIVNRLESTDWASWNRRIIGRLSVTALRRIKLRAWQLVGRENPR